MRKSIFRTLGIGQQYAIAEMRHHYEKLQVAVNSIDLRAGLIAAISVIASLAILAIRACAGAVEFGWCGEIIRILSVAMTAVVLYETSRIMTDRRTVMPGKHDLFWDDYVRSPKKKYGKGTTEETADEIRTYEQSWGEYSAAVNALSNISEDRGRRLQRAAMYFMIQIVLIMVSVNGPLADAAAGAFWDWICGPEN